MKTPSYLSALVNSDSQNTGGRSVEIAGGGGGSLIGLAPVTVANASSRIASPEQSDFFMTFLPLHLSRAGLRLILRHARI
jgi:hypothetical protein